MNNGGSKPNFTSGRGGFGRGSSFPRPGGRGGFEGNHHGGGGYNNRGGKQMSF